MIKAIQSNLQGITWSTLQPPLPPPQHSNLTDLLVFSCYSSNTPSWLRTFPFVVPSDWNSFLREHPKSDTLLHSDFNANALPSWKTSLTSVPKSSFLANPSNSHIILITVFQSSHLSHYTLFPVHVWVSMWPPPSECQLHGSCIPIPEICAQHILGTQ